MPGVTIRCVSKRFQSGPAAVDDVNLEVPAGAFVTLLGPSGSGKTTTLRMIAGLETPSGGEIAINDQVVFGPRKNVPTHLRKIGMVFQSYAIWPHLDVFRNIAFPLEIRGDRAPAIRSAVDEIIGLVGLAGLERRLPAELSGGQQQRVALARALVAKPAVLLFDEPLSNLDAKLRESMRALIKDVHARMRLTAVYVTHDQSEAIWLSDTIYVMNKGRVEQSGTPQDIYERPASLFVAEFIGQGNLLPLIGADASSRRVRTTFGAELDVQAWSLTAAPSHAMIRFSDVRVYAATSAPPGVANLIPGRLSAIQFLGDRFHIETAVGSDCTITAHTSSVASLGGVGQEVCVELPVERLSVLGH